jgi:hypothetical protein
MLKKFILTVSVIFNLVVLIFFGVYLLGSVLDQEMYKLASMKYFFGDHPTAEQVYDNQLSAYECLNEKEDNEEDNEEAGFELTQEDGQSNKYEGTSTVSGVYTYRAVNYHGLPVTFELDAASEDLVPQDELFSGRVAFGNYDDFLEALGLDDLSYTDDCDTFTGTATIQIDGYTSVLIEAGVTDTTTFVEALDYSEGVLDCS